MPDGGGQRDLPGLAADVQEFLDHCLDQNRSRKTVATYRQVLGDFASWVSQHHPGVSSVTDLDRQHIQAYARALRLRSAGDSGELSSSTRAKYLATIRSFLRYFAVETDTPVLSRDKVRLPRVGDRLPSGVPTAEQVQRLLAVPDPGTPWGLRDRAILALFFSSGLRIAELCALDRKDVRETRLCIEDVLEMSVVGKGRRGRIVFVGLQAQHCLHAYLSRRDDDSGALFIHYRPGLPHEVADPERRLGPRMIQRVIRQCALKAGLPELITPHSLRHGFAVDLLLGGADLRTVQELLGHRSVTTTQVYTRLTNQNLREAYLRRRSLNLDG